MCIRDSLKHNPDGKRLISVGMDNTLRVWETASHSILLTISAHQTPVDDAAIRRNGSQIASTAIDGSLVVWNGEQASDIPSAE